MLFWSFKIYYWLKIQLFKDVYDKTYLWEIIFWILNKEVSFHSEVTMLQPPWDTMFASGFFRFAFPVPIFFINTSAHHLIRPCHIHPHFYHNHPSAMQQWLHNDSISMKRKDYTGKIILIILISIINIINIIVAISGIIISRARREGEEVEGRRQPEWNVGSTRWSPFPLVYRPNHPHHHHHNHHHR